MSDSSRPAELYPISSFSFFSSTEKRCLLAEGVFFEDKKKKVYIYNIPFTSNEVVS